MTTCAVTTVLVVAVAGCGDDPTSALASPDAPDADVVAAWADLVCEGEVEEVADTYSPFAADADRYDCEVDGGVASFLYVFDSPAAAAEAAAQLGENSDECADVPWNSVTHGRWISRSDLEDAEILEDEGGDLFCRGE